MVPSLSFGELSSLLELPRHGSQSLFQRFLLSFGASLTWFPVSLLENTPLFLSFPNMVPSLSFGEFSSLLELPRHGSKSLFWRILLSFGASSSWFPVSFMENSPLFWSFPDMVPSLSFGEFSSLLEIPGHGSQSLFWRILLSFGASPTRFPVLLLENSPLSWSFPDMVPSLSFGEFSSVLELPRHGSQSLFWRILLSFAASPTWFPVSLLENSVFWSFPDMVPSLSFGEFSLLELPRHGPQSLFWRILLSFGASPTWFPVSLSKNSPLFWSFPDMVPSLSFGEFSSLLELPRHGSQSLFWRILLSFGASPTCFPVSPSENSPLFWSFPDMVPSLSLGEFSSLLEVPRHGSLSLFRRILLSFGASPTCFPVSLLENSPLFWRFPDMVLSLSFGEFSSLLEIPRHGSHSLFWRILLSFGDSPTWFRVSL